MNHNPNTNSSAREVSSKAAYSAKRLEESNGADKHATNSNEEKTPDNLLTQFSKQVEDTISDITNSLEKRAETYIKIVQDFGKNLFPYATDMVGGIRTMTQKNPLTALAGAAGAGFVVGTVARGYFQPSLSTAKRQDSTHLQVNERI